ncbi:BolA/IbaG family iron-sulfur metabolism protein, partial [Coxiella burnetii]
SFERRRSVREAHLQRLKELHEKNRLLLAGPLLNEDNENPIVGGVKGSLIVAEFENIDVAREWAAADPYVTANVYSRVTICPFKKVLPLHLMNHQQQANRIKKRLTEVFNPQKLIVTDESGNHIGHPGAQEGKGHFKVEITAKAFKNKNPIERHRLIYEALSDLMETDIHALRIHATAAES